MRDLLQERLWVVAAIAILVAARLAYQPGLSGGFQFDDYVNLDALGASGPIDDAATFWRYITSGTADPIGRPLALLSFLLDARDWPAEPGPFLRTNLLIHLLNGALLLGVLMELERWLQPEGVDSRGRLGLVFAGGCWVLHPLFVSTTLYAVQREAMLPATFALAGLWSYCVGRRRLLQEPPNWTAWAMLVAGLVFGTILAALSKANGILVPILAASLEFTVLRRLPREPRLRTRVRLSQLVLIGVPALIVLYYLLQPLAHGSDVIPSRGWSIFQRLITEPRVLFGYAWTLIVPRSLSNGLFNDNFAVSTGWLSPATTIVSVAALGLAVALAVAFRTRTPRLSAAVLFYLSAQLLESTTIPLELAFEHRNYMSALLLFWPLGQALARWRRPAWIRHVAAAAILLVLASTTYQRSSIWGQPDDLAAAWAIKNPTSSRAQAMAAISRTTAGRPADAVRQLSAFLAARPYDLQIAFNLVDAECRMGSLSAANAARVSNALRGSPTGALLMYDWLSAAIDVAVEGSCAGLDLPTVTGWVASASANPANASAHVQDIEPLLARLAMALNEPDAALAHYRNALAANVRPELATRQAAQLAEHGFYGQALQLLDDFERMPRRRTQGGWNMTRVHAWVLARQNYWPNEIAVLRSKLRAALREQG
jgi:tetratricopeptide (TPR) repeat protein